MRLQRLTDEAIAKQIGEGLRNRRLKLNKTQEEAAESIGVSTPTWQNLERGKGTISTLIAAMRALSCLELLTELISPPRASPIQIIKSPTQRRVRASGHASAGARASGSAVTVSKAAEMTARLDLLIPKKGQSRG